MLTTDNAFSPLSLSIYSVTIIFYTIVYMVLMVLPLHLIETGASNTSIGWVMGITMLTSMFCRPLAGKLIDKKGATVVFIWAVILFGLSLLTYFIDSVIAYWFARLIQGFVAACFSTAMEIITINILSTRLRGQGLSLYSLATMLPAVFSPVLVMYLKDILPIETIFGILVMVGLFNIVCALLLCKKTQAFEIIYPGNQKGNFLNFVMNKRLALATLIIVAVCVYSGTILTFLPLYLQSISSEFASRYFLIQMLVLICARFLFGKHLPSDGTLNTKLLLCLISLIFISSMLLYAYPTSTALVFVGIMNGIAIALLYPLLLTFVSFHMNPEYRGYYIGLFIGGADLGFALGGILMGAIADLLPINYIFLVNSYILLLSFVPCFYLIYFGGGGGNFPKIEV